MPLAADLLQLWGRVLLLLLRRSLSLRQAAPMLVRLRHTSLRLVRLAVMQATAPAWVELHVLPLRLRLVQLQVVGAAQCCSGRDGWDGWDSCLVMTWL